MESFDLNIEHYDYDDILDLFNLKRDHGYSDLKQAFKIVAKTHPDKSKLPKEYFLFFKRAYKILLEMYKIRHKKNNYRDDFHEKDKELLSEKLTKSSDFHTTFNRLFEKTTKHYFKQNGHGDWLKEEGDEVEKGRPGDRILRFEHAGGHDGRDRIGGVVQPVQEIEQQGDADQRDQQGQGDGFHDGRFRRGR